MKLKTSNGDSSGLCDSIPMGFKTSNRLSAISPFCRTSDKYFTTKDLKKRFLQHELEVFFD